MKVVRPAQNVKNFGDLKCGDVFILCGCDLIRIKVSSNSALSLCNDNGCWIFRQNLSSNDKCIGVDAELVIKG